MHSVERVIVISIDDARELLIDWYTDAIIGDRDNVREMVVDGGWRRFVPEVGAWCLSLLTKSIIVMFWCGSVKILLLTILPIELIGIVLSLLESDDVEEKESDDVEEKKLFKVEEEGESVNLFTMSC